MDLVMQGPAMLCLIKNVNIRVMLKLINLQPDWILLLIVFPLEYCLLVSRFFHPPQITQKV